MNYKKLSIYSWEELNKTGDIVSGYHGIYLGRDDYEKTSLLIFIDENGKSHFVLVDDNAQFSDIYDPHVNGLKIELKKYKIQNFGIFQFIDLECSKNIYINEFTEVIKEITKEILDKNQNQVKSVYKVINNWKYFWGSLIKNSITEDEQVGLICELYVLKRLCSINLQNAVSSWKGPLGEKHDFIFSEWIFEIKGTQKDKHIHLINGIDQLKAPTGKEIAIISFLVSRSENKNAKSLQEWIDDFEIVLQNNPLIIDQFNKLLIQWGYSLLYKEEYSKNKYEIYDGKFYKVDNNFPKLTSDLLKEPLNSRITGITYTIDLEGLDGDDFDIINLGEYFY